ncbi:hypothetical protein JOD25_001438 [Kurthia huakuii]|nr:hypothetical protein [Kurthia huakuii]MBM7699118.1 hypothetical protein [Kurthia huakuii]
MNQFILPLGLEAKLQKNDIAIRIYHLGESIPREAFRTKNSCNLSST